jgi:hypothetical protein
VKSPALLLALLAASLPVGDLESTKTAEAKERDFTPGPGFMSVPYSVDNIRKNRSKRRKDAGKEARKRKAARKARRV